MNGACQNSCKAKPLAMMAAPEKEIMEPQMNADRARIYDPIRTHRPGSREVVMSARTCVHLRASAISLRPPRWFIETTHPWQRSCSIAESTGSNSLGANLKACASNEGLHRGESNRPQFDRRGS
jgi:hypothetical protein